MTLATYSAFAIAAHEAHEIRPADRQLAQSAEAYAFVNDLIAGRVKNPACSSP